MRGNADALCRPNNNIECAIIMRVCYLLNIPMTISAGRTNLTGSATPEGGIIISIAKMKDIGVINFKNNEIECSPGAYLEDLRNHVINESNNKLIFSVDPTSRKEAMVGGAISCNASGFVPGVKGAMRYWVNGLEWDWSISRERHFGIPIPVWECKDCKEIILPDEKDLPIDPLESKKSCPKCKKLATPESKVLDTWATSSLTPQITSNLINNKITIPFSLRPQAHDIIRTWAFYTIVKSLYHIAIYS